MAYVCEELAGIKETAHFENADQENDSNLGWALVPEVLLKEVLQITRQDVPEEFCCLSTFMDSERCLLKIGEIEVIVITWYTVVHIDIINLRSVSPEYLNYACLYFMMSMDISKVKAMQLD